MTIEKPEWWFRATCEAEELKTEPDAIEYLRMWTGETFIHTHGTAYWDQKSNHLDEHALILAGITHWRVRPLS